MKSFLLSIFLLISSLAFCQDWFPFPHGQISYFEQYGSFYGTNSNTTIHSYCVDSIKNYNSYEAYFFNYKSPSFGNCYEYAIQGINSFGFRTFPNNERPDSITLRNDSLFINYYYNDNTSNSILMIPSLPLNNYWFSSITNSNYNRLKFTCDSIYIDTIIGNIVDSIKTFCIQTYLDSNIVNSPLSNKHIIISKNYGFKQIVSFKNSPGTYFPLLGISNETTQEGYSQPTLFDYFHLQVGDKIIWKYYEQNYDIMTPDTTYHYRDSITNVVSFPDSVIYNIYRIYDNGQTQNTTYQYYKRDLKGLLSSTSSYFTGNNLSSNYLCSFYKNNIFESSPIYETNNIITRDFTYGESNIDTSNCYYYPSWDVGEYVTFDTKYGLKLRNQFFYETNTTWSIVGSTINGIQEGTSWEDFLTSTKEIKNKYFDFNVYPNPVYENGNIFIKGKNIESIEIYNLQGQKIATYRVANNQLKINLSKGIYIMKAISGFRKDSIQKLTVH